MKVKNFSLPFLAFLQATGLLVYIGLVALFISGANTLFGPVGNFLGPVAILLLFVVSAIACALMVLGRAGFLFWEKRYREAFTLTGWTLGWAVVYLLAVFIIMYTSK